MHWLEWMDECKDYGEMRWWGAKSIGDVLKSVGGTTPPSSPQRMINDSQKMGITAYCCYYLGGRRAVILRRQQMLSTYAHWKNPCAHWSACHSNAQCVGAVNQETVPSQCKSGRLPIAFWRICIMFMFLLFSLIYLCLCLFLLFIICPYYSEWM